MTSTITQSNLFKPRPSKAETKADITDHAARAITDAEIERREAKTAKLRQARLEKETMAAAQEIAEAPRPKPAAKRRAKSAT